MTSQQIFHYWTVFIKLSTSKTNKQKWIYNKINENIKNISLKFYGVHCIVTFYLAAENNEIKKIKKLKYHLFINFLDSTVYKCWTKQDETCVKEDIDWEMIFQSCTSWWWWWCGGNWWIGQWRCKPSRARFWGLNLWRFSCIPIRNAWHENIYHRRLKSVDSCSKVNTPYWLKGFLNLTLRPFLFWKTKDD